MDIAPHSQWQSLEVPDSLAARARMAFWNQFINNLQTGKSTLITNSKIHSKDLISKRLSKLPSMERASCAFFTSGSTGQPKVVIHHFESLLNSATISTEVIQNEPKTKMRFLSALPWFHVGGFLNLIRENFLKQDLITGPTHELFPLLKEGDVFVGVPAQLHDLLTKVSDIPPITFYCGGGSISKEYYPMAKTKKVHLIATYGQTESAGAILYRDPESEKTYSLKDVSVTVSNGRLSYKTMRLAHSILSDDKLQTLQSPYVTQDLAKMTEDHIEILGRNDDIFICGGENISKSYLTKELEDIFQTQVFLLIYPDHRLGQIAIAFIKSSLKDIQKTLEKNNEHPLLHSSPQRPRYLMELPKILGIKPSFEELRNHYEENSHKIKTGGDRNR